MYRQKSTNKANKVNIGITLDQAVVKAINERKGKLVKKSTYINNALTEYLGLGNEV
jgi:hypothetical protein